MAPTSPSTWQLIGQLSTIGLSFVFALVIGFGAGYWLDGVLYLPLLMFERLATTATGRQQ